VFFSAEGFVPNSLMGLRDMTGTGPFQMHNSNGPSSLKMAVLVDLPCHVG